MITHLEPVILEGEVKRALGSITINTASGGDGIPVELFHTEGSGPSLKGSNTIPEMTLTSRVSFAFGETRKFHSFYDIFLSHSYYEAKPVVTSFLI